MYIIYIYGHTPPRIYLSNVNAITLTVTHLHLLLYRFTSLPNIFTNQKMVTNQNNKKTKLLPHLLLPHLLLTMVYGTYTQQVK